VIQLPEVARWLLLVAAAALPFHDLTLRVGPIGLRPFETLLLLAAIVAAPTALRCRAEWARLRGIDREIGILVLLGLLSLLVTRGPGESARTFRLVIAEPALFYLLATRLLPDRPWMLRLVLAIVGGGLAASLLGFIQLLTGIGPIEAEGVDRIRGAYRSPNNLALYLDRAIPLAAALALARWRGDALRAFAAASGVAMLGAMALTYSVGGWLATAASLALVVVLTRGWRALAGLVVLGGVCAGALLAVAPERVISHLDFGADSTSGVRVLLWGSALEMLRDHPLFGVGLDNFVHLYNPARGGDYMAPAAWREPDLSHPHNLLLDFWLSLGVLGVLLLIRLIAHAVRLPLAAWQATAGDHTGRALAIGLTGALAAGFVHGAIDNSFFLADLATLWWASYGMLARLADADGPKRASHKAG
jgi:O-antigen ligase